MSEQKRLSDRKRNILIFIQRHLCDLGYIDASQRVAKDTNLSLDSMDVADNIDLDLIFHEFEEYYSMKFGKKPKLVTRKENSGGPASRIPYGVQPSTNTPGGGVPLNKENRGPNHERRTTSLTTNHARKSSSTRGDTSSTGPAGPSPLAPSISSSNSRGIESQNTSSTTTSGTAAMAKQVSEDVAGLEVVVTKLRPQETGAAVDESEDPYADRVLKPLPMEFYSSESRELASMIQHDILTRNPGVNWKDIVGLERAKHLVKEAVIFPMKYPEFFKGHSNTLLCIELRQALFCAHATLIGEMGIVLESTPKKTRYIIAVAWNSIVWPSWNGENAAR